MDTCEGGLTSQDTALLGEAIDQYRSIGMPKHLAMAEGMLKGV